MRGAAALPLFLLLFSLNLASAAALRADDDEGRHDPAAQLPTKTPIKHLVVIFDENISFDHYFATYPNTVPNQDGSVYFGKPKDDTPPVNGLTPTLLSKNPNFLNGGSNPFRLDRSQAATCNNSNAYTNEQKAFDGGLVDNYAVTTPKSCAFFLPSAPLLLPMGYYDGNTVTALWNYAQYFAMSDNTFDTLFGTTVMGHMNLLSGQTNGLIIKAGAPVANTVIANGSIVANVQPYYDDCAVGVTPNVVMTGKNVGDLMNAAGVSWGWFYGDFAPVSITSGLATCTSLYNNHYAPFDYYQSTANPHHFPPTSLKAVGTDTCSNFSCANHNYDLQTFLNALAAGNMPAVTYLKFAENDTGHAADSTPLLEQTSLVNAINAIEQSPFWRDTAIVITYDDTGGWYDHQAGPVVNFSEDPVNDAISGTPAASGGTGSCGKLPKGAIPSPNDRCGFGVRMPLLVISPYAKENYVDHSLNDTTSILRFIEYNWNLGTIGDPTSFDVLASGTITGMFDFDYDHGDENAAEARKLILDPNTGMIVGPRYNFRH